MTASSTKFVLERDMTYSSKTWLEFQGLMVKEEFRTPWGICDLAGVKLSKRYIDSRLLLDQVKPVGNAKRVALLECIPVDRDASIDEIASRTDSLLSFDALKTEVRHLLVGHFIEANGTDRYRRLMPKFDNENMIVAVEIKLSKIEEVWAQARANLAFAKRSYIGIPTVNAERLFKSARIDRLRAEGVGLLSVERGICDVLIESTGREEFANSAVRAHCIERFWRAFIDSAS
jgi:hypothetical protein